MAYERKRSTPQRDFHRQSNIPLSATAFLRSKCIGNLNEKKKTKFFANAPIVFFKNLKDLKRKAEQLLIVRLFWIFFITNYIFGGTIFTDAKAAIEPINENNNAYLMNPPTEDFL
ncbi:MAG: hypothetical protein QG594_550 [Bacteroidota bacterium]|nr:hypothetical protein [Bacteroidota bacterium]